MSNMINNIPILYNSKDNCCGCAACSAICPRNAIYMESDEEGFDYPVIDKKKCIGCYMCIKVCPLKTNV